MECQKTFAGIVRCRATWGILVVAILMGGSSFGGFPAVDEIRLPVKLGIETIKRHNGFSYISEHKANGLCIKLDRSVKEVARFEFNGTMGLVFDGDSVWTGVSRRDENPRRFTVVLKRRTPPTGG